MPSRLFSLAELNRSFETDTRDRILAELYAKRCAESAKLGVGLNTPRHKYNAQNRGREKHRDTKCK